MKVSATSPRRCPTPQVSRREVSCGGRTWGSGAGAGAGAGGSFACARRWGAGPRRGRAVAANYRAVAANYTASSLTTCGGVSLAPPRLPSAAKCAVGEYPGYRVVRGHRDALGGRRWKTDSSLGAVAQSGDCRRRGGPGDGLLQRLALLVWSSKNSKFMKKHYTRPSSLKSSRHRGPKTVACD